MSKPKRGLPQNVRMRHDRHFVDDLTTHTAEPIGRLIALSAVHADPEQPRQAVGDIDELVASVKEKGILEPILVRALEEAPNEYQIISGERRYRAALQAGLIEIPAIVMEVTPQEALEIALVENLQRRDLTAFEEAEGYEALAKRHGYTHAQIARAVGKSRPAVSESLALLALPAPVRQAALALGVATRSVLIEVSKLEDPEAMVDLLERVARTGLTRDDVRHEVKQAAASKPGRIAKRGRPKPYRFRFRAPDKRYNIAVDFRQKTVEPHDLIEALEAALREVRQQLSEPEDDEAAASG